MVLTEVKAVLVRISTLAVIRTRKDRVSSSRFVQVIIFDTSLLVISEFKDVPGVCQGSQVINGARAWG
jgi:hypothetical protein